VRPRNLRSHLGKFYMLPFGHLAAGYLIADSLAKASGLPPNQAASLTWWGIFFAFAPDLDVFYSFWKAGGFTPPDNSHNHRGYFTHGPLLWLTAGSCLFLFGPTAYWRFLGLLLWLCSWSHFVLDSGRTGVPWLWPFRRRLYAFREPGVVEGNPAKGFFPYWLNMLRLYKEKAPLVFWLEIALVLVATVKFAVK